MKIDMNLQDNLLGLALNIVEDFDVDDEEEAEVIDRPVTTSIEGMDEEGVEWEGST